MNIADVEVDSFIIEILSFRNFMEADMTTIKEKMIEDYMDRGIADSKAYRLLNRICEAEKNFKETLTEEQLKLFKTFRDLEDQLNSYNIDDALKFGFEFALKAINELKES